MGNVVTSYDVMTRYMMRDQVSGQAKQMTRELRTASAASGELNSMLGRVGAVVAGYMGFSAAKQHLIDFNSEMEQAKLSTAGFMAMSGLGTFNDNIAEADALVKQYTIDARSSIATTADFVEMSKNLTAAVTGAGGSVKDLHDMTKGLVIAAKAMHMDPNFAAMETEEALMGVVTMRNRFAKKILQTVGYTGEEGRSRYGQLDAHKRLTEFQRAMGGAWLKDLAGAQEHSMMGAQTTFIDNAQLAAMRAGRPLFDAIKKSLNEQNTWLISNSQVVDHISDVVGGKLLTGYRAIKDITQFVAEHWKGIALIVGTMKMGSMASGIMGAGGFGSLAGWQGAGGLVGMGAGMAGGLLGLIKKAFVMAGSSPKYLDFEKGIQNIHKFHLPSFAAQLGIATVALTGLAIGAQQIAKWVDSAQSGKLARQATAGAGTMSATMAALGRGFGGENELRQQLYSAGLASDSGVNSEAFKRAFQESGQSADVWAKNLGIKAHDYMMSGGMGTMAVGFGNTVDDILNMLARRLAVWNPDHSGLSTDSGLGMYGKYNVATPKDTGKKGDIKVTIQRIEVTSDDPDRFAFGLDELVQTAASRRGLTPGYTPPAWRGAF